MEQKTKLLKIAGNLGGALIKATILTLISNLTAAEMRKCGKDVNERLIQNIRFIKNQHLKA
jgi:hypothetical protein